MLVKDFDPVTNEELAEHYEPIMHDEPFTSTTVFDTVNERHHCYHINSASFPGLLPRHTAEVVNQEVEISLGYFVPRRILRVELGGGQKLNIEIGSVLVPPRPGAVLQSAIYGDVRQCSGVVLDMEATIDPNNPTYTYTGEEVAVKLIRKKKLNTGGAENPLQEIASSQFIHDQFVSILS